MKSHIGRIAMATLVLTASLAMSSESSRKVYPRDDAKKDAGLAEVRQELRQAIERRDPALLLPVLAPVVKIDHDKTVPRDAVLRECAQWTPEVQNTFWRDLQDALDLGFAKDSDGRYAYAPYLFVTFDSEEAELAITGANVRIHAAPRFDSPVIERLSYDIVQVDPHADRAERQVDLDGHRYAWLGIVTPSGASGWVPDKYARYNTGPTFVFERLEGRWRLISFVIED